MGVFGSDPLPLPLVLIPPPLGSLRCLPRSPSGTEASGLELDVVEAVREGAGEAMFTNRFGRRFFFPRFDRLLFYTGEVEMIVDEPGRRTGSGVTDAGVNSPVSSNVCACGAGEGERDRLLRDEGDVSL